MNQETITITQDQYHLIINALNELRNRCIRENIDTTDIEDALLEYYWNNSCDMACLDYCSNNKRWHC